jgi:methylated-DNA-[protein]-cysteine S-methyltransferase
MSHPSAPTRCRVPTPFRRDLLIIGNGEDLLSSEFVPAARARARKPSDALLAEAWAQVEAYFARRLTRFDLPLALFGTAFQVEAWRAVAALAFGEFVSYADVARAIGKPLAHRGVAAAMAKTTIDLFVPAHRVVGADGRIKGAGPRSMRRYLAEFELARAPGSRRRRRVRWSLPRIAFDKR